MAFPLMALIAAGASVAGNAAAADAAASSSIEGAKRYADTQRSQLALNEKISKDQLANQQPFYQFGTNALGRIGAGGQSGYYPTAARWGNDAMSRQLAMRGQDPNGAIMDRFRNNMAIADQDMSKQMDWDRVKIGFGEAGSAGNWLGQTGNARANLNNALGQILAQGQLGASMAKQNFGANLTNTASTIPAYSLLGR